MSNRGLLDPKVDFIFSNIFGVNKNRTILMSFLNSALNLDNKIVELDIQERDEEKEGEDFYSRIDVKAKTSTNEALFIDIHLKNDYNSVNRSIAYLGDLAENKEEDNFEASNVKCRKISINILNIKCLKSDAYHNVFRFKETKTHEELTDMVEIHFIEIPKLLDDEYEVDNLAKWVEFLRDPESEKVKTLEREVDAIRDAKDILIDISQDDEKRKLYNMRASSIKSKISDLEAAEKKGLEAGVQKGLERGMRKARIEDAKNFLLLGVEVSIVAKATGLDEGILTKLSEELRSKQNQ